MSEPDGTVFATFTLEIAQLEGGPRVCAVRVMRNPDKLTALSRALAGGFSLPLAASKN